MIYVVAVVGGTVTITSLPLVVAALCGIGATHLTEFLTKKNAPDWLKSGVNLALSTLAGCLTTIIWTAGTDWKTYVASVAFAWLTSFATHYAGMTQWAENIAPHAGLTSKRTTLTRRTTKPRKPKKNLMAG